jgi:hypothetical protein
VEYGGHFLRKVSLGHYDHPCIPLTKSLFQPQSPYSNHQLYRTTQSDVARLPWEITLWLEYGLCEWNTDFVSGIRRAFFAEGVPRAL